LVNGLVLDAALSPDGQHAVTVSSRDAPAGRAVDGPSPNVTPELADWDYELLVQELADLQKMDFDLGPVGFSADELHELFQAELESGLTDPDEVPAPPDEPITRPGDLWVLGPHREIRVMKRGGPDWIIWPS